MTLFCRIAVILLSLSAQAEMGDYANPDPTFDPLDGTGESGAEVNVIEWQENRTSLPQLEIHVYKGSLAGMGLKLDKRNKNKPVMVIAYRFGSDPGKVLTRRAILGFSLQEGFNVYKDGSAKGYEKYIITNDTRKGGKIIAYNLDAEPKQLYPENHPALANKEEQKKANAATATKVAPNSGVSLWAPPTTRAPASDSKKKSEPKSEEDEGRIKPFAW